MPRKINKKRNEKGDGNLRYRANGTFEYRINYTDVDGTKKRKSFYGQSDIVCMEKAQHFLDMLEKKKTGIDMDATIVDIVKEKCKSDLEKNFVHEQGFYRNMYTLSIIEKSAIGKIPIADLTEGHIAVSYTHLTLPTIA